MTCEVPRPEHPDTARLGMALRLPVFAATSTMLGVVAHTVAAGALPSARGLALGLAAVAGLGLLHRRREAGFESVTALLLAAQAVLHVVLHLGAAAPAAVVPAHHATTAGIGAGQAMLLVHVLAAGVAGWWLAHGEAAVWAAVRRVRPRRPQVARPGVPVVVRARTVPGAAVVRLRDQVGAVAAHPRRGPPAAALG